MFNILGFNKFIQGVDKLKEPYKEWFKGYFKVLEELWFTIPEHPACERAQDKIEEILSSQPKAEVLAFLESCNDRELHMLYPMVENLDEYHDMEFAKEFIRYEYNEGGK